MNKLTNADVKLLTQLRKKLNQAVAAELISQDYGLKQAITARLTDHSKGGA